MSDGLIAVIGATGAVGLEVLQILAGRGIDSSRVVAIASERSVGKSVPMGDQSLAIRPLAEGCFANVGTAIFGTDAAISREWCPKAVEAGAVVVDNSSAFRMDPAVPLIVPEVNGDVLRHAHLQSRGPKGLLIANPNCSTIILLMALTPLRDAFGVEHIVLSTYQAVSGAGIAAMDELRAQAQSVLDGVPAAPVVFKEPCAFNVFSHDSAMNVTTGLNGEEQKIIDETRKIWQDSAVRVSPTCVRVPVLRAHTQAITARLKSPATLEEVRRVLAAAPGVRIVDDRLQNSFPTPLKAAGRDEILIGRTRCDPGEPFDDSGRTRSFSLLICGDQLRKGAALNAVQIADELGCLQLARR
jgi:aspartate-semialdehyde dehydrogenase